jgi:GNAT superfamily N-acetyltransferase
LIHKSFNVVRQLGLEEHSMDEITATQDVSYKCLSEVSDEALRDLNALLSQLSEAPRPITPEYLQTIIDARTDMFIATAGRRIVGLACLVVAVHPRRTKGWLEDVVVDDQYRGQGIAQGLMKMAIERAKLRGCDNLNLTSSAQRARAHSLYESLGFEQRDVNVYRLNLT